LQDRLDPVGAQRLRGRDQHRHQPRVLLGGLESDRHLPRKRLHRLLALDADDSAPRTGHAHVGDVGGATRQHARVRGRDVGVRTDDRRDPTVQVPTHRDLFAGRLGMHVDQHVIDAPGEPLELRVGLGKRRAARLQMQVPGKVDDAQANAVALDHAGAPPGLAGEEVRRPHDARVLVQIRVDLAVAVGVVAERDHVDAQPEQLVRRSRRDSHSPGHVLAVCDDEVQSVALAQFG